jgi:alanyl-tRNA synthetase
MMTSDQVRQAFLDFFSGKEHKIIPSASLIPKGDPTLLLTTAGMVQFKPYFLGEAKPPHTRLASCQKCFRTTDIEAVGDSTHLTFFEMLGNFSVGDYFKKEAIAWGWEFVTKWLKLPKERLWVTIFLDDDESFGYWRGVGVPEERILRFGEEDNFWGPAGDSGPCGPCSEIHYDFGDEAGCGKPSCKPNCDCGRFSEIWNLVFTQYNQDKNGKRTPLPKPNIDTGMGLERTVAAVNNKSSVYETDLFASLIENISEFIGKKYGSDKATDKAMRVVVEHGRALTFLIADGVDPSNEGRGYVLRRLLRRAALFGRRLGLDKPFLNQIAGTTVGSMTKIYPELQQRQNHIYEVIEAEEARFRETLKTGLELLNNIMAERETDRAGEISGEDAFRLYDTYGFPIELTKEITQEQGLTVDMEGFEREMGKQRERARAVQRKEVVQVSLGATLVKPTKFVGYTCLNQKAKVEEILIDEKQVDELGQGQEAVIVLNKTPFYGEMGGQVGDTGEIRGPSGRFVVSDTVYGPYGASDATLHQGKVAEGSLAVGDEVEAIVDVERRGDIARNHTATHLLQFALRQVLGEHVQQRGSLVAPDRLRFDFSHLKALSEKQIAEVNKIVNEKIRQNLPVKGKERVPYKEAIEEGAIALFDEKYGDEVRVLKIGKPNEPLVSAELCGGTHVNATGEIGLFHIISESSIGAGLRRIEAVTGRGAEEYVSQRLADSHKAAEKLEAELDKERKKALALEKELARKTAESLLAQAEVIKGVKVLAAKVPSARMEILREMSDIIRDKLKSAIVVLGTVYQDKPAFLAAVTPDLVEKGYDAGKIVKQVAGVAGGSGGGKASLAQAGGKDKKKLDEALKLVKSLV